ncbi:methyltransferase domain-containing protein [Rhizobium sp. CSW-27]|uniref:methyltransferase domain-containing protein n=1 Tax=Rhizobium sp. CSW-27 TaxID=2839985 RepID=UPI001C00BA38|nr:methyltransferase domain-containing protein [Rhizobium sp. CSW-27]MBT9370163.1 class I SAM-dependent methyltransferase [Rhizobium sp. CSW-27]
MADRIISGSVKADGSILQGQGFQVSHKGAGHYLIVFQPPLLDVEGGMVHLIDTQGARGWRAGVASVDGLHATIRIDDAAERACDGHFSFVFSGRSHGAPRANQTASMPVDPTQVVAEPAIGSPPPIVSFPISERIRRAMTAEPPPPRPAPSAQADSVSLAQQAQIDRLKQMTQQVLQRLQMENRMLKSKLALLSPDDVPESDPLPLPPALRGLPGAPLLARLIDHPEKRRVLDIGPGLQARLPHLLSAGKAVSAAHAANAPDAGVPEVTHTAFPHDPQSPTDPFDAVLACHVLQREANPHRFLRDLNAVLAEGGWLLIAVPTLRFPLLGGDLTLWTGGLLLHHLVLAGFDCREAGLLVSHGELCLCLEKRSLPAWTEGTPLPALGALRPFLPPQLDFIAEAEGTCFNGDIRRLNW